MAKMRPTLSFKVAQEPGKDSKIDFGDKSEECNFAGWAKKTKNDDWYINGTLPDGRFFMAFLNKGWKLVYEPESEDNNW